MRGEVRESLRRVVQLIVEAASLAQEVCRADEKRQRGKKRSTINFTLITRGESREMISETVNNVIMPLSLSSALLKSV